jgi:hypothetical protein
MPLWWKLPLMCSLQLPHFWLDISVHFFKSISNWSRLQKNTFPWHMEFQHFDGISLSSSGNWTLMFMDSDKEMTWTHFLMVLWLWQSCFLGISIIGWVLGIFCCFNEASTYGIIGNRICWRNLLLLNVKIR